MLLDKNSEGTITDNERAILEQLVAEAEHLMLTNAERLAEFVHRNDLILAGLLS